MDDETKQPFTLPGDAKADTHGTIGYSSPRLESYWMIIISLPVDETQRSNLLDRVVKFTPDDCIIATTDHPYEHTVKLGANLANVGKRVVQVNFPSLPTVSTTQQT